VGKGGGGGWGGGVQNTTKLVKATPEQILDTIDSIKLVCESLFP